MVPGFTERDALAADERRRQLVADAQRHGLVSRHAAARDAARPAAAAPSPECSSLRGASAVLLRIAASWVGTVSRLTARP